jgi:glycine/D-amino acid oxidase-like deaminating enzyme
MTRSYWHIKNNSLISRKIATDCPSRVDVAVIGGGLVGIATAYYLKGMGCQHVAVLEKNFVGHGASGRNAGFLLSGMAEPYSRLVVGMGQESARMLTRATIENHDLIARAIADNKIDCDYRRSGSYHLAVSEIEANELKDSVELLRRDGFEGEYIESNQLRDRIGFGSYSGAFFNSIDGNLDPFAYVNGLAAGLDVIEQFDVKQIGRGSGGVEISDGRRSVLAEMAILATNAYSPLIDTNFEKWIFPVRGQMLAVSSNCGNSLSDKTYYANFGYDYFRQALDGTIVMGGLRNRFVNTEVGFEDSTTSELQGGLENYIAHNLNVEKFAVNARWSGVMGNTIDGLPLVGPLPHNSAVIAAVGYNGHGFGLGMIVARDLARAVVRGETSDLLRKFSLKRFV